MYGTFIKIWVLPHILLNRFLKTLALQPQLSWLLKIIFNKCHKVLTDESDREAFKAIKKKIVAKTPIHWYHAAQLNQAFLCNDKFTVVCHPYCFCSERDHSCGMHWNRECTAQDEAGSRWVNEKIQGEGLHHGFLLNILATKDLAKCLSAPPCHAKSPD